MRSPDAVRTLSRYDYAGEVLRRYVPADGLVFDVGAGDGITRPKVLDAGHRWFGFDVMPTNELVQTWDLSNPCPTPDVPDAILLLDVIEHLGNHDLALKNISAIARKGSLIIVTTPNPRWSKARWMALFTGYQTCFQVADLDNGHVFPVWPHVLEFVLEKHGFEVIEYATLDGPTSWPSRAALKRYPVALASALACKAVELWDRSACGMSYGVVARKL
jgi:SAM-dependent methyltransferase